MLARSVPFLAILGLASVALATTSDEPFVGISNGHHDTKRGSEFYFDIAPELATRLDPGDLLEPDDFTQAIVYYGEGIGFCVNPDVPAGTSHTVYRFNGARHERALAAAREAEANGEPRDEAVWAEIRRGRGETPGAGAPAAPVVPDVHARSN